MKLLGGIAIVTGAAILLVAAYTGSPSNGLAWTPVLVGLLSIFLGHNCMMLARFQGRLRTMESKLLDVSSMVRSQESVLGAQQMGEEVRQQDLP